mgnify:CR=1 FL=1
MKLVKKIKWLSAVTVLAIGITSAGIAFASPAEHGYTSYKASSGYSYHYGHNGPYDYWCNSNQNYQHSGQHNWGGHR